MLVIVVVILVALVVAVVGVAVLQQRAVQKNQERLRRAGVARSPTRPQQLDAAPAQEAARALREEIADELRSRRAQYQRSMSERRSSRADELDSRDR
jgi:uncharacterized protein HemX